MNQKSTFKKIFSLKLSGSDISEGYSTVSMTESEPSNDLNVGFNFIPAGNIKLKLLVGFYVMLCLQIPIFIPL